MDRIDESIDGSTGRSVDEFSAILQTAQPPHPALGSVLHGQHPHNSVIICYIPFCVDTNHI